MSWKDRLQPASFRGIPFKVDGDDLGAGRRTVIHEYPGRDKPSTEDMGRETREYSISAYVIGPDFMSSRDQLITAIETAGPGELVSPWYGAMQVVIQGKQRISHRKEDGGMAIISFTFTEAGEDDWPTTTPLGSSLLGERSSSLLERAQNAFINAFSLEGLPEWMSMSTVDRASSLLGDVADQLSSVDSMMAKGLRLMRGDLSVLMPPPSTSWLFARRLAEVLDVGGSKGWTSQSLLSLSRSNASATKTPTARPTGGWSTGSAERQQADTLANEVSALVRVNLITTSADALVALPEKVPAAKVTTHPALDMEPPRVITTPAADGRTSSPVLAETITFDDLEEAKQGLVEAIDRESERTTDDGVYQALRDLRREVITTIKLRQQGSQPLKSRTPAEVSPALVLAAEWYDDAGRADEIVSRNRIAHPGFVPPEPLRTLSS